MADDGGALAWRLWAALEGGALALALLAAALLEHARRTRTRAPAHASAGAAAAPERVTPCTTVLVTDIESELGRELKQRLEAQDCTVSTSTVTSGADAASAARAATVDALVVVGADRTARAGAGNIEAISRLVSEDVYHNLKLMERLASRVRKGGAIAWACAGEEAGAGAFSGAEEAFDAALQASLRNTANSAGCTAVWCGRAAPAQAARRLVAALAHPSTPNAPARFSLRNAAYKISGCVGRWLKIAS